MASKSRNLNTYTCMKVYIFLEKSGCIKDKGLLLFACFIVYIGYCCKCLINSSGKNL